MKKVAVLLFLMSSVVLIGNANAESQFSILSKDIGPVICEHARSEEQERVCLDRVRSGGYSQKCDDQRDVLTRTLSARLGTIGIIIGRDLTIRSDLQTVFYPTDPTDVRQGQSARPVCTISAKVESYPTLKFISDKIEYRIRNDDLTECNFAYDSAKLTPNNLVVTIKYYSRWFKRYCVIETVAIH